MKIILGSIILITIIAIVSYIYYNSQIPIVIISYNNLFFVKNFIRQLKRFPNPIIVMDNKSSYEPLFEYYKQIKQELGSKIDIRLLPENYGSGVYLQLKHTLPNVFILSDPDLELNSNMPVNFSDILYRLSNKYKAYKVAVALDISEPDKLLNCKNYTDNKSIVDWESQYWKVPVKDSDYELYKGGHPQDTTFCLINNTYPVENKIRIAGNFTAKHLPWYKNYLEDHIPEDELKQWKNENNSSSILMRCLKD